MPIIGEQTAYWPHWRVYGMGRIQDRKERWKNKLDNLKKEREKLLKGAWDVKKGRRLDAIDRELDKLCQLVKNAIK
jgi:hypothetical protein